MNTYVAERFDELIDRLLLRLEPIDAARRRRLAQPIEVAIEPRKPLGPGLSIPEQRYLSGLLNHGIPLADTWDRLERHHSCLLALRFRPGIGDQIDLRVLDPSERFVPRRLRIPLLPLGAPDLMLLAGLPIVQRSRRLGLFPGAAYDVSESGTGLRGRAVVRVAGKLVPARWPRVDALDGNGLVVGAAHGDQHGEFLLLLAPEAIQAAALPSPFTLSVWVRGRKPPPAPPASLLVEADPFWDIPQEVAAAPGTSPDPVMDGTAAIPAYTASVTQPVTFTYGVLISSGVAPFEIT